MAWRGRAKKNMDQGGKDTGKAIEEAETLSITSMIFKPNEKHHQRAKAGVWKSGAYQVCKRGQR